MEFTQSLCPNCGAALVANAFDTKIICEHCKSVFNVKSSMEDITRESIQRSGMFFNKHKGTVFTFFKIKFIISAVITILFIIIFLFTMSKFMAF